LKKDVFNFHGALFVAKAILIIKVKNYPECSCGYVL